MGNRMSANDPKRICRCVAEAVPKRDPDRPALPGPLLSNIRKTACAVRKKGCHAQGPPGREQPYFRRN